MMQYQLHHYFYAFCLLYFVLNQQPLVTTRSFCFVAYRHIIASTPKKKEKVLLFIFFLKIFGLF